MSENENFVNIQNDLMSKNNYEEKKEVTTEV